MSTISTSSRWWVGFLVVCFCGLRIASVGAAAKKKNTAQKSKATSQKAPAHQKTLPRKRKAPTSRIKPVPKKVLPLPGLPQYGTKKIVLSLLLKHARKYNPTLRRLRRRVKVLRQRERQAGPWPDLKIGISGTNFPLPTFNPTSTAMSGIIYSVSQRFPILQRLSLQKKMAKFNTSMIKEIVREKEVWVFYQIRRAIYWLIFLKKALKTEEELHRLTGQAASVARTKYVVGKAPQQNYLQALTLQSLIRDRMVILVAKERIWRHRLRRLLGANSATLLGGTPLSHPILAQKSASHTVKQAISLRGSIRRWKVAVKQAKTLVSLAKVRYWPDVTLQLSVRQRFANPVDNGAPFISLGLKIPIPSWGNSARHGLAKEAMSRHHWARSRMREARTRFQEQARITITQIKQREKQISIAQRQTIPLAMQTYRSALSNYQVNKVDFLTLLSNIRTLFKEKLKLERLRTNHAALIAFLHAVSGEEPSTLMKKSKKKSR